MPQAETPPKPADEVFIAEAEAKMAALVRLISEQPNDADRITAIVVLSEMWASIGDTFKAAITAKQEMYKIADETKDPRTMARLARDTKLEAALVAYRKQSERYLGELLASEERE